MRRTGSPSVLVMLVGASLVGACAGAPSAEETAPPPTPLPSLRTPTRSLGPTDSPEPSLRRAPDPEAAHQQLLAAIPTSIVGGCERVDAAGAAVAQVSCSASGVDRLTYALFEDEPAATAAYERRLDGIPQADREGPGCGRGPGAERLLTGRRTCLRDGAGATVIWTNHLVAVLAGATRDDGDWAALERFWEGAGPITP